MQKFSVKEVVAAAEASDHSQAAQQSDEEPTADTTQASATQTTSAEEVAYFVSDATMVVFVEAGAIED